PDDAPRRRRRGWGSARRRQSRRRPGPAGVRADAGKEPAEAAERRIRPEGNGSQEARRRTQTRRPRVESREGKSRRRPRPARVRADTGKESAEAAERRVHAEIEWAQEARRRVEARGRRRDGA